MNKTIQRDRLKAGLAKAGEVLAKIGGAFRALMKNVARVLRFPASNPLETTAVIIAFFLVAALGAWSAARLLRAISPKSQIIVSQVEILAVSSDEKVEIQSSKALADLVVDNFHQILEQAGGYSGNMYSSKKSMAPIPDMPHIPVETSYGIEIKGISVDQLMATWNHIRYNEFRVTGSLILGPGGDQTLVLRYATEDRANSFSTRFAPNDSAALHHAISELSLDVVKDINPEAASVYLFATAGRHCTERCAEWWGSAVEFCAGWAGREPRNAQAFYRLGYALSHTEHPGDALPFLEHALQLDTRLYSALNTKGVILLYQGKYASAESAFRAALRIRKNPNLWLNLGTTASRQGNYEEAESDYRKALALDPEYVGAYLNLGHVLLLASKNSEAVEAYRQARYLAPGNYGALEGLARSLASAGRRDDALQECEEAARLDTEPFFAQEVEGLVFLQTREPDRAMEQFESILKSGDASASPYKAEASYYLGMAYARKGDLTLASEQLEETLLIYPNSPYEPAIHNLMSEVLQAQGNLQGSKAEADEAERLWPGFKNDSWDEVLPIFTGDATGQNGHGS